MSKNRRSRGTEGEQIAQEKMGARGTYIDVVLNNTMMVPAFVDSGCLCLATVSPGVVAKLAAETLSVTPRKVAQVAAPTNDPAPVISQIARLDLDLGGRHTEIYAYVIPRQKESLILGQRWLTRHDATLRPGQGRVTLNKPWRLELFAADALEEAHGTEAVAFAASIEDIRKALEPRTLQKDLEKLCPEWLRDLLPAFDPQTAATLPPHRPGLDTEIHLLPGKTLPSSPVYSMSRDELLVLRKTLFKLQESGFIEESSAPGGSPVIFVKKPGGGLRFCVNYRKLNAVSKSNAYPLPRLTDLIRAMANAKHFSKLDVIAAFHRLRIAQGHEWLTTFRTPLGAYMWNVTPFGLKGAPSDFQRFINHVLREWLGNEAWAYLDDVGVYTSGDEELHKRVVRKVVTTLMENGLYLDLEKCEFFARTGKFLGYIIKPGEGLETDPEKIQAIVDWPTPTRVKELRGFLGFANFYRDFVPEFSRIATPLTTMTTKEAIGGGWSWGPSQQDAFEQLKRALTSAPLLQNFNENAPVIVDTDASGGAIGGVLEQPGPDGIHRPIAFLSKKLGPAKRNYPVHDKEMLAVHTCLKSWRHWLVGRPFTVRTDHRNLVFFQTQQTLVERQRRWFQDLAEFDFTLEHRPGKYMVVPDALSRSLTPDEPELAQHQALAPAGSGALCVKVTPVWVQNPDRDQEGDAAPDPMTAVPLSSPFEDETLSRLWDEGLQNNPRYYALRKLVAEGARTFPREWGVAWQINECDLDGEGRLRWRNRLWIPFWEPLRTNLIQQIHDSPLTGHPGRTLTRDLVSREYT